MTNLSFTLISFYIHQLYDMFTTKTKANYAVRESLEVSRFGFNNALTKGSPLADVTVFSRCKPILKYFRRCRAASAVE